MLVVCSRLLLLSHWKTTDVYECWARKAKTCPVSIPASVSQNRRVLGLRLAQLASTAHQHV